MRHFIIILLFALTSASTVFSQQMDQHKHEKNTANSMVPNYMMVVFMHGEDLGLTEEQSKTFAQWQQKFHVPTQEKMNIILEKKKELFNASMKEKSLDEILKIQDEISSLSREIIEQKTNCRDKLKTVLSDTQWEKVVKMTHKMSA